MARDGHAGVRPAGPADLPLILELGRSLHAACDLPGAYDPDHFAGFVRRMSGFVSPRGAILGVVAPSMWSKDVKVAYEGLWWAEDGHGLALIAAFETWAREHGATRAQIGTQVAYRGAATGRLLGSAGYRPNESYYERAI